MVKTKLGCEKLRGCEISQPAIFSFFKNFIHLYIYIYIYIYIIKDKNMNSAQKTKNRNL